jgi:GntR family transcriptional regulator
VTELDRRSALPLWAQLAEDLRAKAMAGDFNERLPTEDELTGTYRVSRNTVREALRRLRDDGIIERTRGRGTFLAKVDIEQPLPGHYSLARSIQDQGLAEHSEVRVLDTRPAGPAAVPLDLAPDEPVVHIERLRYAGDEPLAVDRSWLPAGLAEPILDADLGHGSIYDALLEASGVRVTGGWERITPTIPSAAERRDLRLARPHACFAVERLARSGPRPVEWRRSLIRGDRYRFTTQWP